MAYQEEDLFGLKAVDIGEDDERYNALVKEFEKPAPKPPQLMAEGMASDQADIYTQPDKTVGPLERVRLESEARTGVETTIPGALGRLAGSVLFGGDERKLSSRNALTELAKGNWTRMTAGERAPSAAPMGMPVSSAPRMTPETQSFATAAPEEIDRKLADAGLDPAEMGRLFDARMKWMAENGETADPRSVMADVVSERAENELRRRVHVSSRASAALPAEGGNAKGFGYSFLGGGMMNLPYMGTYILGKASPMGPVLPFLASYDRRSEELSKSELGISPETGGLTTLKAGAGAEEATRKAVAGAAKETIIEMAGGKAVGAVVKAAGKYVLAPLASKAFPKAAAAIAKAGSEAYRKSPVLRKFVQAWKHLSDITNVQNYPEEVLEEYADYVTDDMFQLTPDAPEGDMGARFAAANQKFGGELADILLTLAFIQGPQAVGAAGKAVKYAQQEGAAEREAGAWLKLAGLDDAKVKEVLADADARAAVEYVTADAKRREEIAKRVTDRTALIAEELRKSNEWMEQGGGKDAVSRFVPPTPADMVPDETGLARYENSGVGIEYDAPNKRIAVTDTRTGRQAFVFGGEAPSESLAQAFAIADAFDKEAQGRDAVNAKKRDLLSKAIEARGVDGTYVIVYSPEQLLSQVTPNGRAALEAKRSQGVLPQGFVDTDENGVSKTFFILDNIRLGQGEGAFAKTLNNIVEVATHEPVHLAQVSPKAAKVFSDLYAKADAGLKEDVIRYGIAKELGEWAVDKEIERLSASTKDTVKKAVEKENERRKWFAEGTAYLTEGKLTDTTTGAQRLARSVRDLFKAGVGSVEDLRVLTERGMTQAKGTVRFVDVEREREEAEPTAAEKPAEAVSGTTSEQTGALPIAPGADGAGQAQEMNRPTGATQPETLIPSEEKKTASVPVMITKKMERDLREKGYEQSAIDKMTPSEAWEALQKPVEEEAMPEPPEGAEPPPIEEETTAPAAQATAEAVQTSPAPSAQSITRDVAEPKTNWPVAANSSAYLDALRNKDADTQRSIEGPFRKQKATYVEAVLSTGSAMRFPINEAYKIAKLDNVVGVNFGIMRRDERGMGPLRFMPLDSTTQAPDKAVVESASPSRGAVNEPERVVPKQAWQMTYKDLRDTLESAVDVPSLERIRPLLAEVYPEYVTVDYRDYNQDPWGIGRAIQTGTELPRIPTNRLSARHRELIQAAMRDGRDVPAEVKGDYQDIAKSTVAPIQPEKGAEAQPVAAPAQVEAVPAAPKPAKKETRPQAVARIKTAFAAGEPVPAADIDRLGLKVPDTYGREGDSYVKMAGVPAQEQKPAETPAKAEKAPEREQAVRERKVKRPETMTKDEFDQFEKSVGTRLQEKRIAKWSFPSSVLNGIFDRLDKKDDSATVLDTPANGGKLYFELSSTGGKKPKYSATERGGYSTGFYRGEQGVWKKTREEVASFINDRMKRYASSGIYELGGEWGQEGFVRRALEANRPVNAIFVDELNKAYEGTAADPIILPPGYVREGDMYVFTPKAAAVPAQEQKPAETPAKAEKAPEREQKKPATQKEAKDAQAVRGDEGQVREGKPGQGDAAEAGVRQGAVEGGGDLQRPAAEAARGEQGAVKAPELMTPEELGVFRKNEQIAAAERALKDAKSGKEQANTFTNGFKTKAALVRDREARLAKLKESAPKADLWQEMLDAANAKKPMNAAIVEGMEDVSRYGVPSLRDQAKENLASKGYVREGDLYVFKPEPPTPPGGGGKKPVPPAREPEKQVGKPATPSSDVSGREGASLEQKPDEKEIAAELDRLLHAPATPRGKPRWSFSTQQEGRDFSNGFRYAIEGGKEPQYQPNNGVAQKYQDARHNGWSQGMAWLRKWRSEQPAMPAQGTVTPAIGEGGGTQVQPPPKVPIPKGARVVTAKLDSGVSYRGEFLKDNGDGTASLRAFGEKPATGLFRRYGIDAKGVQAVKEVTVPLASVRLAEPAADLSKLTPAQRSALRRAAKAQESAMDAEIAAGETEGADTAGRLATAEERRERVRTDNETMFRTALERDGYAEADNAFITSPHFRIDAYHGSPHIFDKFSLSRIGTGEGVQAYGYGLYMAQARDVAEGYRRKLSRDYIYAGKTWQDGYALVQRMFEDLQLPVSMDNLSFASSVIMEKMVGEKPENIETTNDLQKKIVNAVYRNVEQSDGALYTVELDADDADLLDWDAPLSQQSEKVRKVLRNQIVPGDIPEQYRDMIYAAVYGNSTMSGRDLYNLLSGQILRVNSERVSNRNASEFLNARGIKGIRYFDAASRGQGDGTHNYVVFDDKYIKIVARNGQPAKGYGPRGETMFRVERTLPDGIEIQLAIDEDGDPDYEASAAVDRIARERDLGITSDRELQYVARNEKGEVVGGAYTSADSYGYTFDVVVAIPYEGAGIGSALLEKVIKPDTELLAAYDTKRVYADVVNPAMKTMLERRGWKVEKQTDKNRWTMIPRKPGRRTSSDEGVRFRVTPAEDAEYMAAVEAGDTEKAQRMVDEAAKRAGYTQIAYHGGAGVNPYTGRAIQVFNVASTGRSGKERGAFFTSEKQLADDYKRAWEELQGSPGAVYRVALNLNGAEIRRNVYDAPTIRNAWNKPSDVFVVSSANQIKSADPITRDDQGNVIPLSQRFNEATPDIRFRVDRADERFQQTEGAGNEQRSVAERFALPAITLPDSIQREMQGGHREKLAEDLRGVHRQYQKDLADHGEDVRFRVDRAQTETPEFRNWFKDSKVVDADGKPLVVYHGGDPSKEISVFDSSMSASGAMWFTDSYDYADFVSLDKFEDEDGRTKVYPVFVSMQNPVDWRGLPGPLWERLRRDKALVEGLIENGYDGVILDDVNAGIKGTSYVAFRPEQIKSATANVGTFDPTNPDIRFRVAQPQDPEDLARAQAQFAALRNLMDKPPEDYYKAKGEPDTPIVSPLVLTKDTLDEISMMTRGEVVTPAKVSQKAVIQAALADYSESEARSLVEKIVTEGQTLVDDDVIVKLREFERRLIERDLIAGAEIEVLRKRGDRTAEAVLLDAHKAHVYDMGMVAQALKLAGSKKGLGLKMLQYGHDRNLSIIYKMQKIREATGMPVTDKQYDKLTAQIAKDKAEIKRLKENYEKAVADAEAEARKGAEREVRALMDKKVVEAFRKGAAAERSAFESLLSMKDIARSKLLDYAAERPDTDDVQFRTAGEKADTGFPQGLRDIARAAWSSTKGLGWAPFGVEFLSKAKAAGFSADLADSYLYDFARRMGVPVLAKPAEKWKPAEPAMEAGDPKKEASASKRRRKAVIAAVRLAVAENMLADGYRIAQIAAAKLSGQDGSATEWGYLTPYEVMAIATGYPLQPEVDTRDELTKRAMMIKRHMIAQLRLEELNSLQYPTKMTLPADKPDVTLRQLARELRDRMNDYTFPEGEEDSRLLNAQAALASRLRYAVEELQKAVDAGVPINEKAPRSVEESAEIKELRRTLKELRASYEALPSVQAVKEARDAERARRAANKRYHFWAKRAEDAKGGLFPETFKGTSAAERDAAAAEYNAKAEAARKEYWALKKASPQERVRVMAEKVAKAEERLAELEAALALPAAPDLRKTKAPEQAPASPAEAALAATLAERRAAVERVKKAISARWREENAAAIAAVKEAERFQFLVAKSAAIEDRIKRGDYSKPPARPRVTSPRITIEEGKVRAGLKALEERTEWEANEARGLAGRLQNYRVFGREWYKFFKTAYDLSAPGVQSARLFGADPVFGAKLIWQTVSAARSDEAAAGFMDTMHASPDYPRFYAAGLALDQNYEDSFGTGMGESAFRKLEAAGREGSDNLALNIAKKFAGGFATGALASQRAFELYNRMMRFHIAQSIINDPAHGTMTDAEVKAVCNTVNIMGGVGNTKFYYRDVASALSRLMWSSRLFTAQWQTITGGGGLLWNAGMARETSRKALGRKWYQTAAPGALKLYARSLAGNIALSQLFGAIGMLLGDRQPWEDEETMFWKAFDFLFGRRVIGGKSIDTFGGMTAYTALLKRAYKSAMGLPNVSMSGRDLPDDGWRAWSQAMANFARGRLRPDIALGLSVVFGKDVTGEPFGPRGGSEGMVNLIKEGAFPITPSEMFDTVGDMWTTHGVVGVTAGLVPALASDLFGFSKSSVPRAPDYEVNRHKAHMGQVRKALKVWRDERTPEAEKAYRKVADAYAYDIGVSETVDNLSAAARRAKAYADDKKNPADLRDKAAKDSAAWYAKARDILRAGER